MPERTPSQTVGPYLHIGLTQGAYGANLGVDSGPTGLDRTREGYVEMTGYDRPFRQP